MWGHRVAVRYMGGDRADGRIGCRYVFATFQNNLIKNNILDLKPKNDTIAAYSEVEFQKAQTRTIPT